MKKTIIILLFVGLFGLTSIAFAQNGNSANNSDKDIVESTSTLPDKAFGQKVKNIVSESASSSEGLKNKVEKLENRSKFKTFLIGTDYKTVGAIRSEMVQTRNEIDKINRLVDDLATSTEKDNLVLQLKALEDTQTKVEELVKANESKFSLFGWFVKLFQK